MPAANTLQYIDKTIYCPFGCTQGQHDEHMYCCHLVGFTSKGKQFEPICRKAGGKVQVQAVDIDGSGNVHRL